VDTAEAVLPTPQGFASFKDFFTRALRPGARPADPDPAAIVSPADGTIQQIGPIADDQLLQVKGQTYGLAELFGGDRDALRTYRGGAFATIYLAPWNYHRVHMPLGGRVLAMNYLPGALWSVNAATARQVPGLFARNQRLICHCAGRPGAFAVILVGAMNVGSISTAWAGEVLPRTPRRAERWDYAHADPALDLPRDALLGQFNLGSTVIVVVPPGVAQWDPGLAAGMRVRVGQRLGRCRQA
jgi:phosphatidylserine decarboxylase